MADFNIRSESVDVEQIMKQIRARLKEKRGVDYTEEQIRELATVRLEKFLDPKNLRSDLLEQFRRSRPAIQADPSPVEPPYTFGDETIYETHRGALRFIRKLLHPLLKLLFNPNPLITVMHKQAEFNVDLLKREQRRRIEFERSRSEWNALYYEVLHNLVLETTRNGIEVKNLKMRVEALASRLDFSERRVRALEGVVQYRPEAVRARPSTSSGRDRNREPERGRERPPRHESSVTNAEAGGRAATPALEAAPGAGSPTSPAGQGAPTESTGRRRRRRRRGRRGAGLPLGAVATTSDSQTDLDMAGGDEEIETEGELDGGAEDSAIVEVDGSADAETDSAAFDEAQAEKAESHNGTNSDAPSDPDQR